MQKKIEIILAEDATEFLAEHDISVRKKFAFAFRKTQEGYKGAWFKDLKDTDGLYEFRVEVNGIQYRLMAFWDKSGKEATLIVNTHGFIKKTQQTPKKELKKAKAIKLSHFQNK